MRRRNLLLALAAVAVVGLVCAGIVLFSGEPPSTIAVWHVKSLRVGNLVTATFGFSNDTANVYFLMPTAVEIRRGTLWTNSSAEICFDPGAVVQPHGYCSCSYVLTNLPTAVPLRLNLYVRKKLTGVGGVFRRLKLRFVEGQKQLALNPAEEAWTTTRPIQSGEFTEPTSPPSPERSPTADSAGLK